MEPFQPHEPPTNAFFRYVTSQNATRDPKGGRASDSRSSANGRVLIGVCTYQEAGNVVEMLRSIRDTMPEADVLVVDDNSPDGTAELVGRFAENDPSVSLMLRTDQRGLGTAIVAAIHHAIQNQYEFFLNLDGDFSHDPRRLPALLAAARQDESIDVVVGSRYVEGGAIVGWPCHRRLMSRVLNQFATRLLGLPVRDCSGSMRCYRVSALEKADIDSLRCQGYALLEELLVRLHRIGCKMAEIPITFTDRQRGESKLTFREALRSVGFMMKLAVNSRKP